MQKKLIWLLPCLLLAACTQHLQDGPPPFHVNADHIPDALPRSLPKSPYGNPNFYVVHGTRYHVLQTAHGYSKRGIASWYGTKFHGHLTSSRELYNMLGMTGASTELPIPSFVRVTNLENGKAVIVKINDRGPFSPNRIIDLSYAAAKKLGYAEKGTALVEVATVSMNHSTPPSKPSTPTFVSVAHRAQPKLYLQLGAFRQWQRAQQLKIRAAALTKKSIIIQKIIYQRLPLYRVQIGPLVGVGESDHLQSKLQKLGFGNIPVSIHF
ncbi:MAG: hypothetical protein A3F41_01320 [Coxiella sp. RIFCSPHIGHO2_12_FULL_44_14]|nr:MAG: hypothetical protein A3F41_01320 [Coxiella sp. RIFCSPHIGHO2_12_FULL_44_14]